MRKKTRPHRIALSIVPTVFLAAVAAAALSAGCIEPAPGTSATDQESSGAPDASVDNGIGTSPIPVPPTPTP